MRDEHLITRQGKLYVLFAGLLDEAHSKGVESIETELLQVPSSDNGSVAIVHATVRLEGGKRFDGIGDASPENVGRNIAPHIIRMAETRAKARALRDATNVGAGLLDELEETGGDETPRSTSTSASPSSTPASTSRERTRGESAPSSSETSSTSKSSPGDAAGVEKGGAKKTSRSKPITDAQREKLGRLALDLYPDASDANAAKRELASTVEANWKVPIPELSSADANKLIRGIEKTLRERAESVDETPPEESGGGNDGGDSSGAGEGDDFELEEEDLEEVATIAGGE